jgi:3-hydroxyacyl-CoA dehydrogenase
MIRNVAVVGAGVMGHGIAQLYALAGFPVSLYDIREEYLDGAFRAMEDSLSLLVKEEFVTEARKKEALRRVSRTTDLEAAVKEADFITEAIPEVLEMKWELFERLERLAKPDAIIASNTSTLPISKMAKHSATPHRMIITHFFNPAQLVPLVEIVKHEKTAGTVVETTTELMRKIGKHPVLLKKEVPGFIANRLQAAIVREAFYLLNEGVADARDIDAAITAGPGFRWAFIGPIETADFGGLDTWKRVIDNLAPELDKRESAPERIAESVREGNLGTKTGKGIYSYSDVSVPEKIRERDTNFIRLLKLKRDG